MNYIKFFPYKGEKKNDKELDNKSKNRDRENNEDIIKEVSYNHNDKNME